MRIFEHPAGRLRLELEDRCFLSVKPVWAVPLSQPGQHMALLDGKGREIMMISDPSTLEPELLDTLKAELRRRYLSPAIHQIHSVRTEFGVTYWTVETDRGRREFVTQSLQENAHWMTSEHLVLVDVDGNRYDVRPPSLDLKSRAMLNATV